MQIPTFINQIGVPGPKAALADPGVAGAPGAAIARAGAEVSDELLAFNQRYREARRQADASSITADISKKLGDAQFRHSKTPDRDQAIADFEKETADLRANTLAGIKDPEVSNYVARQFDREQAARSLDTGAAAFQLESSKRRGELDTNLEDYAQSAASTINPVLRAQLADRGIASIKGAVAAGWLNPESGAKAELGFKSSIDEVAVRQALNGVVASGDPDASDKLGQALADPAQFSNLTPEKRASLFAQNEAVGLRLATRAAARQAHEDVEADKKLRQTQADNETNILANVYDGKPVDMASVYRMAHAQQLSAAGLNAIQSAVDKTTAGKDDPLAMAHLWGAIGDRTIGKEQIYEALSRGHIRGETAGQMLRSLSERDKQSDDAVERGAYGQLRTALSGDAAEKAFGSDDKSGVVALWAQAQGEWNRRVTIAKEDPNTVLGDMLPRYSAATIAAPTWLPAPLLGAIGSPESEKDIEVRTLHAFETGQMDRKTFDGQIQLLRRYADFYDRRAAADAAAVAKRPAPAKGGGARLLGSPGATP